MQDEPNIPRVVTQEMRPAGRPTRPIPPEVLNELLAETRPEEEERIREWHAQDLGNNEPDSQKSSG